MKALGGPTWFILAGIVGLALATAPSSASAGLDDRDSEPVVITGSEAPLLIGVDPGLVVAFSFDGEWIQIPVQVDERKLIDYRPVRQSVFNSNNEFRAMAYADPGTWAEADGVPQTVTTPANRGSGAVIPGTTGDPTLDADDEIAMMAVDAGISAGGVEAPAGVDPGTRTPVKVTDPLGPSESRFLYLFRTTGSLDPSADTDLVIYEQTFDPLLGGGYRLGYNYGSIGDNVSGPPVNPEKSRVTTARYELGFPGRWMVDRMVIAAATAPDVDILDGDKSTVGQSGCGRNELTFSRGGGGFIANLDGPVRAIRSIVGANSGTFAQRDYVFYEGLWETRTYLRVHPGINQFVSAMDLAPVASGMVYRNSNNPSGVSIDGVQDSPVAGQIAWDQFSGQFGSVTNVTRLATDIEGVSQSSYYQDMATPNPASSMLCSGDDHSYGVAGPMLTMPPVSGGVNTDPTLGPANFFEARRLTWFDGPEADAALGQLHSDQVDNPLRSEPGASEPVYIRPDLEATPARLVVNVRPARLSLRQGRAKRIKISVRNIGGTAAERVAICARKARWKRAPVGCLQVARIGAGKSATRRFKVRVSKDAATGRKTLWIKAMAAGIKSQGDGVKVRIRKTTNR